MGFIRIYLLNVIFYSMKFKCRGCRAKKFSKINVTQNNHDVANQVGVCKNYLTHDVQVKDPQILYPIDK